MSVQNLIDANNSNAVSVNGRAMIARALISALSAECGSYCILSGYDQLPESFDSDIDFMVDEKDFVRLPSIVAHVAHETNTYLFQTIEHEVTARAFLLASLCGAGLTIYQLDAASDYRHFGLLWLRADEVLAARHRHARGFWIPSAAHEFAYYLIKRVNKRDFGIQHGKRLSRLYDGSEDACDRIMARFWSPRQRIALGSMAASGNWDEMPRLLEPLRKQLRRHGAESLPQRMASLPRRGLHVLDRVAHPTGRWIALMGPDGSGKSFAVNTIREQFASAFRDVRCFHLRPKLLRAVTRDGDPVTDPHGKAPRGFVASIAKVFYLLADYLFGYIVDIAPALIRTRLIVFDRYFYDLLVDTKRVRYGGPRWLLDLASHLLPRPDLVILLDAPPEVLWSRKQEVPFDEVVRQREAYLQLACRLPSMIVVNSAQPVPALLHDVNGALVAHFSRLVARRLELEPSTLPPDRIDSNPPNCPC